MKCQKMTLAVNSLECGVLSGNLSCHRVCYQLNVDFVTAWAVLLLLRPSRACWVWSHTQTPITYGCR